MKRIREIKKLTGGRYLICPEEGEDFPLYGKELEAFGIKEGEVLSEESYVHITAEILLKRARLCALHTLEKMDRTEQQLRDKLTRLHYPADVVDDAIAYVKSFHYINDLRYAENYIESQGRQKSLRRIEQELLAKGISRTVFCEALERVNPPDEEEQIAALLQKKHFEPSLCTREEYVRMYAFLMRRGYSAETVRRALHI